jgi:hypothetical protein
MTILKWATRSVNGELGWTSDKPKGQLGAGLSTLARSIQLQPFNVLTPPKDTPVGLHFIKTFLIVN